MDMDIKFDIFVNKNLNVDDLKNSLKDLGIQSQEVSEHMMQESTCHYLCKQLERFQDFESSQAKFKCNEKLKQLKEAMNRELTSLDCTTNELSSILRKFSETHEISM